MPSRPGRSTHLSILPTPPQLYRSLAKPEMTAKDYLLGTTKPNFAEYSCIDMDDAIIAKICAENRNKKLRYAFIRNISDPAQNPDLDCEIQKHWSHAIYEAYGFYSSFNGALTCLAVLSAETPR